ncbi:Unconventional myosin-XV [Halotydeus destructor]|nr:Unconventional myosin-XV [Halotydeus destructor]
MDDSYAGNSGGKKHANGTGNGNSPRRHHNGDLASNGSYSSADEEIQESSCWIESKSDQGMDDSKSDRTQSSSNLQDGKFSMLQFALFNFKEALEKYQLVRNNDGTINESSNYLESLRAKKKKKSKAGDGSDWTWRELADLVKFSQTPMQSPLLKLNSSELNKLALDCFAGIMRYMGDQQMAKGQTQVDCVYTILVNCHRYPVLRDEVYCQVIKQTTNNKSTKPDSCVRGWRLFAIIASYFDCSDNLRPYLLNHLETAAYDKRRAYHAMALLCLQNLRKTFKYGGRKNVPSIEEIAAISVGRNSKRQMYRLPGGTERIINTASTTVVQDVIDEICAMLSVRSGVEREEFSLYCIVEGDPFTMPLNKEEYILDVTTELLKNGQTFYLIFCRSVWVFPLRLDNPLYIEVIFNQVAPDYLEGLLLVTPGDSMAEETVVDVARLAALLHRAAEMAHSPTKDEVKYLLPKPILPMREIRPPQWIEMVQGNWVDMSALTANEAKAQFLDILQKWPLFGSCFFAIKRLQSDSITQVDNILALNRDGVHFLHPITHENIWRYSYSEVISTRKVRAEDGTLYLDMKCGNLMAQKITRIQSDQAHEISRLIRQYIEIQSTGKSETPPNVVTLSRINGPPTQQPVFST